MEHVVFFPAPDGSPAFRRVAGLDDAVRLVEHLRNVEGVEDVSCHSLTEVPLAFRAYYRVEVPGAEGTGADVAEVPAQEVPPQEVLAQEVPAQEVPAQQTPAVLEVVPDPVEPTAVADEAPSYDEQDVPVPAVAATNGRRSDGAKSLGFFS